jgi:oxygen-dependent protoporphyrinogen oxidase
MIVDVAVIGGGVSGLATAYELQRRGHRVVVLERQVRAGGNAVSERIGGFLMEHGPSTVNAASAEAGQVAAALGIATDRCDLGDAVRYRYLTDRDSLARITTHPFGFLTSDYLSLGARLRLMAEPLLPGRKDSGDETIAGFFSRRFGREFTERVIDPLTGGLYAGSADELSMAAVFPALLDMERGHGSITRAVFARRRNGKRMPGRRLHSWPGGIGTLPEALSQALGSALRTGVAVRSLRRGPNGYRIDAGAAGAFTARAVVLATQPHVAAGLLEGLDDTAAAAAGAIAAPPLAVVFLGYRREQIEHPLDGLGYLTATGEGRTLSGAQFCSTMFPGRAPAGHVALAGYMGGARAPELARLPAADLVAATRDEFADLLGARGEPVVTRVRQWVRGLPQYTSGHPGRVAALRAAEQAWPGLFFAGNYLSGPSIAACLEQAAASASCVDSHLSQANQAEVLTLSQIKAV